MKWTKEQQERFEKFILGDDMDFYEEYTIHLTDKEQEKYAKNIYISKSTSWSYENEWRIVMPQKISKIWNHLIPFPYAKKYI